MGDIAWTRKYRPNSFNDYMGDNIKNLVLNRFKDRNNIPNTIMLSGTRGTGKTSMARLLSKEIHCMSPVDGHSCGECEMCQAIDEYISSTEAGAECPGITEIDAATTTGKDSINEIVEDAIIPPMYPMKHKVLVLDECHMLSVSAQNSLLKVIEEPPSHLIFILCTTDPEKVIGTIHSRMQLKLEVKKKTVDELVDKLLWISQQEKLTISREALQIIVKKGDRIPRECINLLETVAKNYGNNVTIDSVRDSLGVVSTQIYMDYFNASNKSLASILNFNKKLVELDLTPKQFMTGLTRFVLDSLYVKHGINLADYPVDFVKQVKDLFKIYTSSDFDALLQVIESAVRSIDSDDNKSELIITNTAMRIGKIDLLAKGLSGQESEAREENLSSIKSYSTLLEKARKEAIEKVPEINIKKEDFASLFSGMSEVKDGESLVDSSQVSRDNYEVDEKTQKIMDLFNSGN